jgi:hypothetical protein
MLLVPLVTVLETAPLPKLTDSGLHLPLLGAPNREAAPIGVPMGGSLS